MGKREKEKPMSTAKRAIIAVLLVFFVMEVVAIGSLLSARHDAYAKVVDNEMLVAPVSDVTYVVPPEEAIVEPETATPEMVEGPAEEALQEEYYVDEEGNWYYEDYDESGERVLVPYDGSGYYNANMNGAWHAGGDFMFSGGSGYDDGSGFSFTWYSENVLPGGGLDIPGRHVGDEGYVCDENGNVCLASDYLPAGTVVDIPFGNGTGVVYDSGSGYDNLDVYVSW